MQITFTEADVEFLYDKLQKIIENCHGLPEMTFRVRVEQWLHTFFETRYNINLTTYGLHDYGELGPIKLKGVPDAIYGRLIIDYKAVPTLVDPRTQASIIKDFREKYLDVIPIHMRKFFKSIIFDGTKFVFLMWDDQKQDWTADVENFTKHALHRWLDYLAEFLAKNPSARLLSKTFSLDNSHAKSFFATLYDKLTPELTKNVSVAASFEEWRDTFMFLYGSVLSGEKIKKDFADVANGIIEGKPDVVPFLFTLFTYYTLVMTFVCTEMLSATLQHPSISEKLRTSRHFRNELEYVLRGHFFRDNFNVDNYVEDLYNFFWFLDVWDESVEQAIKPLLQKASEFDFLVVAGLTSRDVLKGLYEQIIPPTIRHDLGEIFTPDWLVELALNEVGYAGNAEHTLLDPGCGRGVFLAEAIARVIKNNWGVLDDTILVSKILNNVVGFDINPIGVLTARTNYLIALSPLLPTIHNLKHPIMIPVFMTDSILTPTTDDVKPSMDTYKISTSGGVLKLRRFFIDGDNLSKTGQLLRHLADRAQDKTHTTDAITPKFPEASNTDVQSFHNFYEELSKLSTHEYNAIVTKLESLFAPLKYSQHFDFVVGNPPWVKWEFLAEEYKKKLGVLYLKVYKLFSHAGMRAAMGYAHDDISIVFTYVALDKYLKPGGKFAFLLKQTLYRSVAGKEFRKFSIDKVEYRVPLKVLKVHDLVKISPFPYTQSETSLIIVEKGSQTVYPVPYYLWDMKGSKSPSQISEDYALTQVLKLVDLIAHDAYPDPSIGDNTAPWIAVAKGQKPPIIPAGRNPYDVRHGIVDDLDQVFQVKILAKTSKGLLRIQNAITGKRKTQQVIVEVEPDLIYPLLKPKNIKKWITTGYDYVLLPQRKYGENNENELRTLYPFTYDYLCMFRRQLEKRTSRWFQGKPFYTVFGLGPYTFKPYKVVWSAIGYLPDFAVASSVDDIHIGTKLLIPDNTIGYIALDSEDEAYFSCALLNSSPIKSIIAHKSTRSKWGLSMDLVKQLPLPQFNSRDPDHISTCSLAKEAYKLSTDPENNGYPELETKLDNLAEKITLKAQQAFAKSEASSPMSVSKNA